MDPSPEGSTSMDSAQAQALLKAMADKLGREVTVSRNKAALATDDSNSHEKQVVEEMPDDFYDFTEEDYARMTINRKPEIHLKTKKLRDAEEAAKRLRISKIITKTVMRVQFPDNYILEAKFQVTDPVTSLVDLLKKVISRTDVPFYLYTTPPKQKMKDLDKDFYTAGLAPGAVVHFSYEVPKGVSEDEKKKILEGPYLQDEIVSLCDLHLLIAPAPAPAPAPEDDRSADKPATSSNQANAPEHAAPRPKKSIVKPKWMKL